MDRFINGSDYQFAELKRALQDNRCHAYNNCVLPPGFNKTICRIGFEKCQSDHSSYKLLIDYNIKYNGNVHVTPLLKIWLQNGELNFLDFNDLKVFIQSLNVLL